jgi:hypothetical protein
MPDDVLANILDRLHKLEGRCRGLETFVGHGDSDPVDPAHDRRLTKRQLAQRRGKSARTIDRDVARKLLPPPEFENGRAYWWLSVLQRYEREHKPDKPHVPRRHFARNVASA